MSTSIITSLAFVGQKITIYCGAPLLVIGVFGGICLTLVLLSLQTFRRSSCAFYLTVMSIVDIGQLLTGLLSRLMIVGFAIDWTEMSLVYCKLRLFLATLCTQISSTCLCLAVVDQYFATCSRLRWREWSNIKLARRLTICFILFWLLHDIPYTVFVSHVFSTTTNKTTCTSTNPTYLQYRIYFLTPVIVGILPVSITSVFGIMAYRNVKSMAHRTVPLVRRELDRQLTNIVLVQIPFLLISIVPYTVLNILTSNQELANDRLVWAKVQFASNITSIGFYIFYSSPFYVCLCVSERFRRQWVFVMQKMCCRKARPPQEAIATNQVVPEL